jgi:transglutaminase-like putative cysteine protease
MNRPTPSVRFRSALFMQLAATVLLCSLPGFVLGRVVQGYNTLWVGVVAAVIGTACGFAVIQLVPRGKGIPIRQSTATVIVKVLVVVFIAAILSIVVAVLQPGYRPGSPFSLVLDAFVHGWAELATSPIPALAEPRTLVPVALVSFFAAATSAAFVTKQFAERSDKTRVSPLLVLLAPSFAFLIAVVAAGKQPFRGIPAGLMFVALAGIVLLSRPSDVSRALGKGQQTLNTGPTLRTHTFATRSSLGRGNQSLSARRQNRLVNGATLAALGASTLAGALLIGPILTFGREQQPFDPREYVRPPVLPETAVSPLELVGVLRQAGDQELFTVRASKALYPQDLRLVALNQFDGANWSTTAPYKRGGAVIGTTVRQQAVTSSIEAEVTMTELDGPWIPSVADPQNVTGVSVIVDPLSGSLVAPEKVKKGDSYQVRSLRPELDPEQLILLPVGSTEEARNALLVAPGMPPLLKEMARTAIGDSQLPFQRAFELRNYLRTSFTLDNAASTGFSYGHLERAFITKGEATDEQFATMFATLGREVGLPTRVVVGFLPPPANPQGDVVVHGSDARAWPEVFFEGVGWLPFVATPSENGNGDSSIGFNGQDEVELRETPPEPTPAPTPPEVLQATNPLPPVQPQPTSFNRARIVIPVLVVLAMIALALASVAMIKSRRTAARRTGTPRQAVIGAWRDVLDRLAETGIANTTNMTIEEVVQAMETSSGALTGIYRPVNRALYSDAEITDADQEQAWRARDRFVSSLTRRSTLRQRFLQAINPRPLLAPIRRSIDQPIGARP